jgi:uncharacterized protein (DUF342 family)
MAMAETTRPDERFGEIAIARQMIYYFDTNPMRIGTLLEDGSMDWKNRGEIPQVRTGELLAEKVGGDPGRPGMNVLGQEIAPPRIKDPSLKFGKGAQRSEDGTQILADTAFCAWFVICSSNNCNSAPSTRPCWGCG